MPKIKRRQFLQFATALTALTLSCNDRTGLPSLDRPRGFRGLYPSGKLALLVGINTYSADSRIAELQGCLTDVELQRHLLTYRFGFNPRDILTLTDDRATRQGILEAFEEHLIKQAQPGDVVVFHYSGHGSQVADPERDFPDGLNSTLVPFDSSRPANPEKGGIVQDIMGHTLFLLMAALKTENVTVVLDCCHSGGAERGNLQVRAARGGVQFQASPEERAYQQQWLSRLSLTPDQFKQQRRRGIAKGVAITATNREQIASDYPFGDFTAGAFTYVLSQYLWQQLGSQPLINALPNITWRTTQISFTQQKPEFEVKPGSHNERQSVYFIDELAASAEAVVTKVEGDIVELWLGGIDSQSRAAFTKNDIFAIVDANGQSQGQVQLESRHGLIGRGKLVSAVQSGAIQPGALCLEQVRAIPSHLSLRIGLDPSLGKESDRAKAVLESLRHIEALPLRQGEVHYIFGRLMQQEIERQENKGTKEQKNRNSEVSIQNLKLKTQSSSAVGSLGLFSSGLDPISGSFGAVGETVTDAVRRLQAKFKSLLAVQIVKMLINTESSRINVTASLHRVDQENQAITKVSPTRGVWTTASATSGQAGSTSQMVTPSFAKLPLLTPVQLQVVNNEPHDLYISVLTIDPTGEMTIIFPNEWAAGNTAQVAAGQAMLIPDPSRDSFTLQTQEPKGVTEVLVLASVTPLRKALKALQMVASRENQLRGPVTLSAPIEVIDNLLLDLAESDRAVLRKKIPATEQAHYVSTNQLAAMTMTFEVI